MELTLVRPLVHEFEDPTASSRPPREALVPSGEVLGLFSRLIDMPPLEEQDDVVPRVVELLPFVAAWGD